jgi:hypothetical protein
MNLKSVRTLVVRFDLPLRPFEISAFRGAIIEKVGREHILFNHHISDNKFLYRYPLIQYKSINRQPTILCLGEGVDEIHKLFNKSHWDIDLNGRKAVLTIDEMRFGNATLNVLDNVFNYQLHNWLALSEKNFQRYKNLNNEIEQIEMLEKILVGNILSFAKGMEWEITEQIKVRIQNIRKNKNLKYKSTHLLAFTIDFSTNVDLPQYIGLGKGVSRGYGVLTHQKNKVL